MDRPLPLGPLDSAFFHTTLSDQPPWTGPLGSALWAWPLPLGLLTSANVDRPNRIRPTQTASHGSALSDPPLPLRFVGNGPRPHGSALSCSAPSTRLLGSVLFRKAPLGSAPSAQLPRTGPLLDWLTQIEPLGSAPLARPNRIGTLGLALADRPPWPSSHGAASSDRLS